MHPYNARRTKLISQMHAQGGGVAIIPTAPEVRRNSDAEYPFRHDSYFYYLSGFTEPEAVVVLVVRKDGTSQSILFCREKNLEREIWDGYRYGPEAAANTFGFDAAFPVAALATEMPKLLADAPAIFYNHDHLTHYDQQLQDWLRSVRAMNRSGITTPGTIIDLHRLLDEMRLFKDADEIALMRRAGVISAEAHKRAMRISRPGLHEYVLEAEILHEFRRQGSQAPAYGSIVAAGANACVLHYSANNAEIKDGDLVLIDAGCEFDSYAADITRTFPANGKFTAPQKTLYEIVLASQTAALELTRTGQHYKAGHEAAVKVLAQGMLDTGLLSRDKVGSLEDVISSGAYKQFFMHGTGHWLGMDVHDVGQYRDLTAPHAEGTEKPYRTLQPGMVVTIEPGIYVRPAENIPEQYWNIGIRIEDDVLVTEKGYEIFTRDVPSSVADIEALMRK